MRTSRVKTLRWLRLRPACFGMLDSEVIFDSERLTLIVGRNEAGKSTLLTALVAALYGLADKRKRRDLDPRPLGEDYAPWSGGSYAVELELLWSDQRLLILRDFDKRTLKVLQNGITDITPQYTKSRNRDTLGEVLTGGLSPSAFLRSFLISQEQAALVSQPMDLVQKIQKVVTSAPGDMTTRQALEILDKSLRSVKLDRLAVTPIKIETAIQRLEEEINRLEIEIDELDRSSDESAETISDLELKEENRKQILLTIEKVKKGQLIAEEKELKERIHRSHNADAELAQLEGEEFKLREYKNFPLDSLRRFESAFGSYNEAREQAKEAENTAERHLELLEEEKKQLDELDDLYGIDPDMLEDLLSDLKEWVHVDRKRERHAADLETEKERLAASGVFASRLETVRERIGQWSDDVAERFEELKVRLNEAILHREEVDRTLAQYDLPKNKWTFRFTWKVGIIIFIALFASVGAALEWKLLENAGLALIITIAAALLVTGFLIFEQITFKRREGKYKAELRKAESEETRCEAALAGYAESLGEESPETVEQILLDWKKLAGKGDEYFKTRAMHQESVNELKAVGDRLCPYLEQARLINAGDTPTRGDINGLIRLLEQYRTKLEKQKSAKQKYEQSQGHARRTSERLEAPWNELKTLCEQAEVPLGENVSTAADEFRSRAEKAQQLRDIEEKLHTLKSDLQDKESIKDAERRLEIVRKQLEKQPGIEAEPGTMEELRNRSEDLAAGLRELEKDIQNERLRLGVEMEEIPKKRREVEEALAGYRRNLDAFLLQKDAVECAIEVISEVERDVFGDAANLLNQRLGPILESISPRWSGAQFDGDLKIHATDSVSGKELHHDELDRLLSAGTRDALYLGARLALSDFLAGGVIEAPFVFDEPFAHLDDNRFATGMTMLAQRAVEGRQVIVMTCHQNRHREWFDGLDDEMKEKLNWVDLDGGES